MRIFSFLALFTLVLMSFQDDDFAGFSTALKTGNAKLLSGYFDEHIELAIQGLEYDIQNNYSKVQAKNIVTDFFKKSVVTGFEAKINGEHKWTQYIIGYLSTEEGRYRTLVRYVNSNGTIRIQELELTLEDE